MIFWTSTVSHSWGVPTMKITDLSILCKWETLKNHQCIKYLFTPLYIKEALQQGFIQPSTSPTTLSFFFVGKKDGGLRPCIDYRALNSQTATLPYPLPLVPAALEELRRAHIFSKLDLRSVYNLVRIQVGNEGKTAFITPSGHY